MSTEEKGQRRRRDAAAARVKHVIHKGRAATDRLVGKVSSNLRDSAATDDTSSQVLLATGGESFAEFDADGDSDFDASNSFRRVQRRLSSRLAGSSSGFKTSSNSWVILSTGLLNALYITYHHKLSILTSLQIPLYMVLPWLWVSFLLGKNFQAFMSDSHQSTVPESFTSRRGGIYISNRSFVPAENRDSGTDEDDKVINVPRMRHLIQNITMGPKHIQKVTERQLQSPNLFWSNLSIEVREMERIMKAPSIRISDALMNHLLSFPDFKRRRKVTDNTFDDATGEVFADADDSRTEVDGQDSISQSDADETRDTSIGQVVLNNAEDVSFETHNDFSYLVEPLCTFRGMDMFLSDDPENDIWRQPLLTECGLRDTPTFIGNIMVPFGNVTVYFRCPPWFDDWDNIPPVKEDDAPDLKAFKRFLSGDDEYRQKRAKLVPYVVDGPRAVRLIMPKPKECLINGTRHSVSWSKVPKSVCPVTGQTRSALLECDIDLFSNKTIRRVMSIIRPYLSQIKMDVALIISKPLDSDVDEPSACIGVWRMDRVDFEGGAVFPQKSVDEVAEVVKNFIALEKQDVSA